MEIKKFFTQLFCRHEPRRVIKLAVIEEKKNHDPLKLFPVVKYKCKKCGKIQTDAHYAKEIQ